MENEDQYAKHKISITKQIERYTYLLNFHKESYK